MSWISALSLGEWLVLGLVPPAILMLYFLKLRRKPVEVPSTFLWRRTIEDLHVNSIWQRLRQNLLLYLQLLFLTAIILACLRPGWNGSSTSGKRWIFLIDNSASMQATDESPSRLEHAKKLVKEQIKSMRSGDVAMVLAFSDRADVRQGFTADRQRLTAAVNAIEPTNRTTELLEALRASAGLANPGRASFGGVNDVVVADALPASLYIYSDGGFPKINEFELGNLNPEYVPIGKPETDNVGILAFTVQRNEEVASQVQAFARIANTGPSNQSIVASLYLGDALLDAANVTIKSHEEAGVNFELKDTPEGIFKLEIDRKDELMVDNSAYAALRPVRQISLLLISPGNNSLETSLQTGAVTKLAEIAVENPTFMESSDYSKRIESGFYDLIIYDQCSPPKMPNANTLFIGSKPPSELWKMGERQGPVIIIEWDKRHPTMQYLEMGNLRIGEGSTVEPPEGGTVLMRSDFGPVFSIAPRGPFQDAVLGFPIVETKDGETQVNTDWVRKRSFPVFVYSMVEYLGGGVTASAASTVLPGQPMAMSLSNRYDRFRVEDPKGKSVDVRRGNQSQVVFTQTETPGVYRVFNEGNANPAEIFAVNLFSARESDAAIVSDLQLGGQNVQVAKSELFGRKEWWRWILMTGLFVLVFEWFVYNKRVFV